MGVPAFKAADLIKKHNIAVYINFALTEMESPGNEHTIKLHHKKFIIDECFLHLSGIQEDMTEWTKIKNIFNGHPYL